MRDIAKVDKNKDKDILLVEYQAAQESAQHHDNLIWTTTTIIWSVTLILFGFVIDNLNNPNNRIILTFLSILGIFLTAAIFVFVLQFNSIKRQKYDRCKAIEKILDMYQHRKLEYPKGVQTVVYLIITHFFIIAWLIILWTVWVS